MSTAELIKTRLAALAPVRFELEDESHRHAGHAGAAGGGGHYRLTLVSSAFSGKRTLERHRMVYAMLGELMQGPIHALAITALTPDEA